MKKVTVIDKIEKARSRNNKNWMDLLEIYTIVHQKKPLKF